MRDAVRPGGRSARNARALLARTQFMTSISGGALDEAIAATAAERENEQ